MSDLLSPLLLSRLERLQLATRHRLAGRFSGEHRSPQFGTSVDFADYREYHPGDDFRRIDYPLFARTGNLFIRLFEAEDDVTVRIVVDRSASMGMHGKLAQAVRMAAAIGFVALIRRDTVILHTEPAADPPRRFTGRHASRPLFEQLSALVAAGDPGAMAADLAAVSREVLVQRSRAGVTVVISDLLSEDWPAAVDRLVAAGGDTTVLHLLSGEELRPDHRGDLEMIDVETGHDVAASLSPAALRDYADHVDGWLRETEAHCRRRGGNYVRVLAETPVEDVLLRSWRDEGLLR